MTESLNRNMNEARKNKNDEFFTQYNDIEMELREYADCFRGKRVFCNCNDGAGSKFLEFFLTMFSIYGLRGLYGMQYEDYGQGRLFSMEGKNERRAFRIEDMTVTTLSGDGGYRTRESLEMLDKCDLVITNPPFSLFRDFVALLVEKGKQFLIIGNQNALTYKEIFQLFMENRIWTGYSYPKTFVQPGGTEKKFGNICWYTNLPVRKREEPLELWREYSPELYPHYDNYDAINVNSVADIPVDYAGVMGVPVTYLNVHCPKQFEICGTRRYFYDPSLCLWKDKDGVGITRGKTLINGVETYDRIFIRHRNPQERKTT